MIKKELWSPGQDQIKKTKMYSFLQECAKEFNFPSDYESLYQWSIKDTKNFWNKIWDFCDIRASNKSKVIYTHNHKFEKCKFFPGSKINYAENILKHSNIDRLDLAITFWCENLIKRYISHKELYSQVSQLVQYLKYLGVKKGDKVVGFLPNIPETIIAMLATTTIGAVWASCSPDFGIQGTLDRLIQIQPKILFSTNGYFYKNKPYEIIEKIEHLINNIPSINKLILIEYIKTDKLIETQKLEIWKNILMNYQPKTLKFTPCDFNDPLFIMFSSGTTGKPKCIVHGIGGTLIQHLKEHQLHSDIRPNDNVFYFTTCSWMMWNWHISALASNAKLMLYEGSPLYPTKTILFDYAVKENFSFFGTSAKFINTLQKLKLKPKHTHDLKKLRMIASTGSPLSPESFNYVYNNIKKNICLASIAGGTDIISCFALGNPIQPIYAGELQTRGLGMAVKIFNDKGESVINKKGYLVCTKPFPSKPIYFLNDIKNDKYRNSYFNTFNNIWNHGDFVKITKRNGIIFYGRSDSVLNPSGIRIGTAEIYRQIDQIEEIIESVAVGQNWEDDIRILLFIKLKPKINLTNKLIEKINNQIQINTTKKHVPYKIIAVPDIPHTINGKISEISVQATINNLSVKNKSALANPESLLYYKNIKID